MSSFAQRPDNPPVLAARDAVLQAYVASLVVVAVILALALGLTRQLGETSEIWAVLTLIAVAALSERGRVQLSGTMESSIALLPVIFAAVVLGPLAALLVGAGSLLGDFRPPYMKLAVYTCTRAITGALAGFAALGATEISAGKFGQIAAATGVAAVVAEVTDTAFAATTHRLRGNGTLMNAVRVIAPLTLAALPMYVPVVAILAAAYTQVSAWTLPLFLVPAVAAQRLFAMYREQRE